MLSRSALRWAKQPSFLTIAKDAVTVQQCRGGGARDARIQTITWLTTVDDVGKHDNRLDIILLEDDPDYGPKFKEVNVKRRIGRELILAQKAVYCNRVTRKMYGHLKPSDAVSSAGWVREWFHLNFRLPIVVPHQQEFELYASDIQSSLDSLDVHLPLDHIYLNKPISSIGEHFVPIMVPSYSDEGTHQQMVLLVTVMSEFDAIQEGQLREGITVVDAAEDDEIELVGGAAEDTRVLRGSRAAVREQMEEERITRLNDIRRKKGLPPLSMPSREPPAPAEENKAEEA